MIIPPLLSLPAVAAVAIDSPTTQPPLQAILGALRGAEVTRYQTSITDMPGRSMPSNVVLELSPAVTENRAVRIPVVLGGSTT
jgi:hypothetical protein